MAEPLRIALLTESYLPYLSGVTVATEALARGLGAAGHAVILAAPAPARGRQPGSAGATGPDPVYAWLPSYQPPSPAPAEYRMPWPRPSRALRRVEEFAPDVIHAQSPFVSGLMARRLARRLGAPLVFTHHTRFGDYRHYLGPLAAPGAAMADAYLRRWWRSCAAVVAPGSTMATEIHDRLGTRRRPVIRMIPTGLDVARLGRLAPRDPRVRSGWPADAIVAVSVGRLAPEKSVDLLVAAFAEAARDEERLRLLLVGDGPSMDGLAERFRATDLAGRAHLTGRLPRDEALALAAGADLFVFASQTETQGLVLAEALAIGLPVVALAGPGIEDTVRNRVDGEVVDAEPSDGRVARLAGAILALGRDAERRDRLAQAARAGAGRFDLVARLEEMEALYRDLVNR